MTGLIRRLYGPGFVMCQICFEVAHKTDPRWAQAADGQTWDLCAGECAIDAGLVKGADGVWRDKEEAEMPKKKPDETPADAVTLDADHIPPIGSGITAYETPWHTVSGEVIAHQAEKGLGLIMENRGGVEIKCTSAARNVDQRYVGERLFIQYGTRYTLHDA